MVYCLKTFKQQQRLARTSVYNEDIVQEVQQYGVVPGQFKCYFQNISGLFINKFGLFKLLDAASFQVLAFCETHCNCLPSDLILHARLRGFQILFQPATRTAKAGRFKGGMLVFVQKQFQLSTVTKCVEEWGEYISFTVNQQQIFNFVYRNPKSKPVDVMQILSSTLNTNLPMFFVGDWNFELLQPTTKLLLKSKTTPINIKSCTQLPFQSSTTSCREATSATSLLSQFPLYVVSSYQKTSAANRCIDFALCNQVAVNTFQKIYTRTADTSYQILVSDHKSIQFGFDFQAVPAPPPSGQTTLRLRFGIVSNPVIRQGAFDILFNIWPLINFENHLGSVAVVQLALLFYFAFQTASNLYHATKPRVQPTYALAYRNIRQVIQRCKSLKDRRLVLRANRYKYNILSGCNMQRRLLKTRFQHTSFVKLLSNTSVLPVIECSQQNVKQYFDQFFNGHFCQQAQALPEDFWLDFRGVLSATDQDSLGLPITVDELRTALLAMKSGTSPGCFGLDVSTLRQIFNNPVFADCICKLLNQWIHDPQSVELHLAYLSAIPKQNKSTTEPQNLRPISVTSIWYRWIAKVFVHRLQPHVQHIYSTNQHGFCQNRNVNTALWTINCAMEFSISKKQSMYILQLDIDKAYDSVDRNRLDQILSYLGIADSPLYQFIKRATDFGDVVVMGSSGPTTPFKTTRGIRQGCPASPILFAIYISFLERRLLRLCSHAGLTIGTQRLLTVSYADDLTVLCTNQQEASSVFSTLQQALAFIGLTTEASKCKLLHVNPTNKLSRSNISTLPTSASLDIDLPFQLVTQLRILGLQLTSTGTIFRLRSNVSKSVWATWTKLRNLGLCSYPQAFIKGLSVYQLPSLLFGLPVWGVSAVRDMVLSGKSPYHHPQLREFIQTIKSVYGLAPRTFNAPLFKMLGLKSFVAVALPQLFKFLLMIDNSSLLDLLNVVAIQSVTGSCKALCDLRQYFAQHPSIRPQRLAFDIEAKFWLDSRPEGRHSQWFSVFGASPCVWNCMNHATSKTCTQKILSFFSLSRRYFYTNSENALCPLCARAPPTLLHLFTDCSCTRALCNRFGVPMDSEFLRIFLLQRTGRELVALIDACDEVFTSLTRVTLANPPVISSLPIDPDLVIIDTREFLIRFDGSYMPGVGSGIGITLGYRDSPTYIATFSVPTKSPDAQRTEILGPTLAALIVATMDGQRFWVEGDSQYVIGLLNREYLSRDLFLYTCAELVSDVLQRKAFFRYRWIPREQNGPCDALAKQATTSHLSTVSIIDPEYAGFREKWQDIVSKFVQYFVHRFALS